MKTIVQYFALKCATSTLVAENKGKSNDKIVAIIGS